jgi:hypothetical protein
MTGQQEAQAVVREGDICFAVGELQQALAAEGTYGGPIDDIFGFGTLEAVREYQFFAGLAVDGIVGPATASSLGLRNEAFYSYSDSCNDPFVPVGPTPVPPIAGDLAFVDAPSGLVVRDQPFLGSLVVDGLSFGTEVEILDYSYDSSSDIEYAFVQYSGGNGWVSADWLIDSAPGPNPDGPTFNGETFEVTASVLNIRSEPFFGNNVIEDFRFGDVFTTTGAERNGFIQLVDGGWVAREYVRPVFVAGRF